MTWHKAIDKLPKDNSMCLVIIQESLGGGTLFVPESLVTIYDSKKWYPWSIRKGEVLFWKNINLPKDFTSKNILVKNECVVL